ncbi:MAG: Tn3 family transposase [Pseudonocardiaceae bacterium]
MDMLTETALRTGCLAAFTPVGTRAEIDPAVLAERLLLLIYAYGTNAGVRGPSTGNHAARSKSYPCAASRSSSPAWGW